MLWRYSLPCWVLEVFRCKMALCLAYVWWGVAALKVWLDGLVLLVELRQIRDQVLDDVGVGKRVDAGFLGGLGRNAAF